MELTFGLADCEKSVGETARVAREPERLLEKLFEENTIIWIIITSMLIGIFVIPVYAFCGYQIGHFVYYLMLIVFLFGVALYILLSIIRRIKWIHLPNIDPVFLKSLALVKVRIIIDEISPATEEDYLKSVGLR